MGDPLLLKEAEEIRETPMLFILGVSRSGTSLLQEMIDAHSNMIGPMECDFVLYLYPRFGKIKKWTDKDIMNFIDSLYFMPHFTKIWKINKAVLVKKMLAVREIGDYKLFCKMIFYEVRRDKKKILIISDKFPNYSLFPKKLLSIFPDAKFIHIVRDPRDSVNGMIKRLKFKNTFFNARKWVGYNKTIEKTKRLYPEKFFSLRYENMVEHPVEVLTALCEFLNVPFESSMLQHHFAEKLNKFKEADFFERYKFVYNNLLQPVNISHIGKWKNEMQPYDLAVTEIITAQYAKLKYGYQIDIGRKGAYIPRYKLIRSKIQYFLWEKYTRMRFNSFWLNTVYRRKIIEANQRKYAK